MRILRKNRKRADFEELALPHLDSMFGVAMRLTRNPRDAEDLVQEAMLRAYRFWDTFQDTSNCRAWLAKIVTNTFINSYQKKKRTREIQNAAHQEQKVRDGVLAHERALSQKDPEARLLDRSFSDDVSAALESLPEDFRLAVILCDVQELSYKEIAEVMDCPVGTVMSRLYRGRKLLKKALEEFAIREGVLKKPSSAKETVESEAKVIAIGRAAKVESGN